MEIETANAAQKIADLKASQTEQGVVSDSGKAIIDAGTKEINIQLELRKKTLAVSENQEKTETELANQTAKRKVDNLSNFQIISHTISALESQLQVMHAQGLDATQAAAEKRKALNEAGLAYNQFTFALGRELEQQKLVTEQIDAQQAGNKKLAALAQIRAQFEIQIADAIRQGNGPKARELAKQQAAAELGAKAADIRKTPQERADERKEQQVQDRAIRTANAREKDAQGRKARGAYGQRNSNNHVSKATEEARKEFADRNAPRILAAGKDAEMAAKEFKVENFEVKQLKNGK